MALALLCALAAAGVRRRSRSPDHPAAVRRRAEAAGDARNWPEALRLLEALEARDRRQPADARPGPRPHAARCSIELGRLDEGGGGDPAWACPALSAEDATLSERPLPRPADPWPDRRARSSIIPRRCANIASPTAIPVTDAERLLGPARHHPDPDCSPTPEAALRDADAGLADGGGGRRPAIDRSRRNSRRSRAGPCSTSAATRTRRRELELRDAAARRSDAAGRPGRPRRRGRTLPIAALLDGRRRATPAAISPIPAPAVSARRLSAYSVD